MLPFRPLSEECFERRVENRMEEYWDMVEDTDLPAQLKEKLKELIQDSGIVEEIVSEEHYDSYVAYVEGEYEESKL